MALKAGRPQTRALRVWAALAAASILALLLALSVGSTHFSISQIVYALVPGDGPARDIVLQLRLPRALAAFAAGGLLAVAGALMQVLLRNPLADPYILGLSGGAAVGALCAMVLGLGALLVDAGAFAGALLAMALVFMLARREFAYSQRAAALDAAPKLLLVGVILAAGWSAIISLLLALAPDAKLRGMIFWIMGDLAGADTYAAPLIALVLVIALVYPSARELNVLARGEAMAAALGVEVALVRRRIYLAASLATALAVTTAGTIGFVGLVVPHALRLAFGNDQRLLLPGCALAGGTLLVLADTLARTVVAPQQLPVGVITAILGVPSFLVLLLRRREGP